MGSGGLFTLVIKCACVAWAHVMIDPGNREFQPGRVVVELAGIVERGPESRSVPGPGPLRDVRERWRGEL